MLVNVYHDSPREHRRLMAAGVAFLTVIALLIALSIAIYDKALARMPDEGLFKQNKAWCEAQKKKG